MAREQERPRGGLALRGEKLGFLMAHLVMPGLTFHHMVVRAGRKSAVQSS